MFNVLYRMLRLLDDDNLTYIRYIIDMDDKINARTKLENISIEKLTFHAADEFDKK